MASKLDIKRAYRRRLRLESAGDSDPYWENVSFLLSADGLENGSQAIEDLSDGGAALTIADVSVDTSVAAVSSGSFSFGDTTTRSIYRASGAVDWLKKDEDWTIECFLRQNALTAHPIAGAWDWTTDSTGRSWVVYVDSAGKVTYYVTASNTTAAFIASSIACDTIDVFNHIVVQNNSDSIEIYVDGTLVNTPAPIGATPQTPGTPTFVVGGTHNEPTNGANGYMDQLRITKGVARYSDGYTVPTAPFPTQ